jgi:sec-independent protein translocase protein TatA
MLSASHLFLIFLIVLLFFGAKRLPEIARAMGKAVNEFKKAKDEVADAIDTEAKATAAKDKDASATAATPSKPVEADSEKKAS